MSPQQSLPKDWITSADFSIDILDIGSNLNEGGILTERHSSYKPVISLLRLPYSLLPG